METLLLLSDQILDIVFSFFSAEGGMTFAMVAGVTTKGVEASRHNWHKGIDKQMANIENAVDVIDAHRVPPGPTPDATATANTWPIPATLYSKLNGNRNQLRVLVAKCRTPAASSIDREERNLLLKETIQLCLVQIKSWAYGLFFDGTMTAADLHLLGFLAPGEKVGSSERVKPTDVIAEVKVQVVNEDYIRVVVDQSAGENAGPVLHGWPEGVEHILIVINDAESLAEVYRQISPRLHNDIKMPENSHGKQFIIRAAFLRHVDDAPRFGNEPTFSMPLTTLDLATQQAREIERLRAELEKKNS